MMGFTDTLFVTAGLVDDDDLAMDSPHPHLGFGVPGSPGPGAIGQPTTMYTQTRKVDDLGLTNLLARTRLNQTNGVTEYGVPESVGSIWDDWGRSGRGLESGPGGAFDMKYGTPQEGPRTAPLFPTATDNAYRPPQATQQIQGPVAPMGHAATQAMSHLASLQGLIGPMARAAEEVEKLKKEAEMWKNEWAKVGEEKKGIEQAVLEYRDKMESNKAAGDAKQFAASFSVVLIDGDGLIFQDALLQAGYKGGLNAARKLRSSLSHMLSHAQISPTSKHFGADVTLDAAEIEAAPAREIGTAMINVFLNKAGLGQVLINAKIVPDWKGYNSFFEGLSAAHELISIIDVGPGKEAADAKIRGTLYARSPQCEMIVLGASHDNGYANILSSLQTENRLSKLLLLKGYTDLAGQLRQYMSRVVVIPDLFRTTKVPLSFSSIAAAPPTPASAPKKPPPAQKSKSKLNMTDDDDRSSAAGSVEVLEWKEVAKKPTPAKKDNHNDTKVNKKKKFAANGKSKGYSVRTLDPRPCHTYYLSDRGCKAGENCDYSHDYNLNDEEIDDLRRLAKEMVCPYIRNNKCHYSEEECVYGHFCPRGDSCKFGDSCRFRSLPNGHGEED